MGLSGDQKALLRLLAQREQGYEEIAALMGLSVGEVRARVKDALDAVEREGGEPPLLPAEREPLPAEPAPKPKPAVKAKSEAPASAPARKNLSGGLPKERRVLAIAGGLGVIVIVIVLLATGVIGGGDDSGSASSAETSSAQQASLGKKVTGAILRPLDGGDAEGRAVFGKEGGAAAMIVEATGLEPSGKGSSYAVWLYKSPQQRLPLIFAKVEKNGQLLTKFKVPTEVLAYLAAGTFDQISITLGDNKRFAAALAAARKAGKSPSYAGEEVLRGKVTGPLTEIDIDKLRREQKKAGG